MSVWNIDDQQNARRKEVRYPSSRNSGRNEIIWSSGHTGPLRGSGAASNLAVVPTNLSPSARQASRPSSFIVMSVW